LTGIDGMLKVCLVMIFYNAEVVLDPVDIDIYALKKEHKITDRSAGQLSYFKRTKNVVDLAQIDLYWCQLKILIGLHLRFSIDPTQV
jgi:hypothetical protein